MTIAAVMLLALAAGVFLLGTSMASSAQGRYTIDSGASDPEGQYNQFAAAAGLPLRQSVALGCMGDPDPAGCTLRKQWDDLATLSAAKNSASMVQTAGALVGLVAIGLLLFVQWPQRMGTVARAHVGAPGPLPTSRPSSSTPVQGDLHREAIAEAIKREPALAQASDPASMALLAERTAAIEQELRLRHDLEAVKSAQAAEAAAKVAAAQRAEAMRRKLEADRKSAEQDAARREQERLAKVAQDEKDRLEREAYLATLSPSRRWIATHRLQVTVAGVAAGCVVLAGVAMAVNAAQTRAEEDRASAAAAAASASASASAASASASASAEASASAVAASASASAASASASAAAAADAVAQAARDRCMAALKKAGASLAGCDLSGANLARVNLAGRDLTNVNFTSAVLTGAVLDRAKLSGVTWTSATCPNGDVASSGKACSVDRTPSGTEANPMFFGQSKRVGDWKVVVYSLQANAKSNAIATADGIQDQPTTGFVYAILRVKLTWLGVGTGNALNVGFDINGVTFDGSQPGCTLITDIDIDKFLIARGQSSTGTDCIYMETAKTRSGVVHFGAGTIGSPLDAYWRIG